MKAMYHNYARKSPNAITRLIRTIKQWEYYEPVNRIIKDTIVLAAFVFMIVMTMLAIGEGPMPPQ